MTRSQLNEADVLDAFAMEPEHDRETFERYLQEFPQYASALSELQFELTRADVSERELDASDELLIAKAWSDRVASYAIASNPLASLEADERHEIANKLGVKKQIMTLFRTGGIIISTVPHAFMARFAELLEMSAEALEKRLNFSDRSFARAYKSETKPKAAEPISFEEALRQCGASEAEIAELMREK